MAYYHQPDIQFVISLFQIESDQITMNDILQLSEAYEPSDRMVKKVNNWLMYISSGNISPEGLELARFYDSFNKIFKTAS